MKKNTIIAGIKTATTATSYVVSNDVTLTAAGIVQVIQDGVVITDSVKNCINNKKASVMDITGIIGPVANVAGSILMNTVNSNFAFVSLAGIIVTDVVTVSRAVNEFDSSESDEVIMEDTEE